MNDRLMMVDTDAHEQVMIVVLMVYSGFMMTNLHHK